MNSLDIKHSLDDLKNRLKFNFCHLTDQDLIFDEKNTDDFIYRLQQKLGSDRNEVLEILKRIQQY